jgi:L-idonate 5-dehydrogenase
LTLVTARLAGARFIAVTDPVAYRREKALALGADAAIDPAQPAAQSRLESVIGSSGADLTFDAVGIPATFAQAIQNVRRGGTVIAIGGWQIVPIDLQRVVTYELTVRGTMNYVAEFDRAIALLSHGLLDHTQFITYEYPMSEGPAAFHQLANQPADSIKVVLTNEVEPLRKHVD